MVSKKLTIRNKIGFQLQVVTSFIKTIQPFDCDVFIFHNQKRYNGRSALGVISANVVQGDEVDFICDGVEEAQCLEAIEKAVEAGFDEKN